MSDINAENEAWLIKVGQAKDNAPAPVADPTPTEAEVK